MASILVKTLSNNLKAANLLSRTVLCPTYDSIRGVRRKAKSLLYKFPKNVAVDQGNLFPVDLSKPQLYFDNLKELETADERIKKIFSLEFANQIDYKYYEEMMIKDIFKKDELEDNSLEIDTIYRRERMLGDLRKTNYDRYIWVKEKLGLVWEPATDPERRTTRYGQFKMEVKAKERHDRNEKLKKLENEFNLEKVKFFKEKELALSQMLSEIKELGFNDERLDGLANLIKSKMQPQA